ncbi:LamG-like jellyroll fold domain-containing protein [Microbacterium sp. SSM24]|uniref:LamG-like jellyroll fold domain-containing protein n=1 Tax=Microbacterium sp. SSM24 TaxID=2991714 RepID=UPI002227A3DA|nr:LamG-like jellyroll fold domain-containing protein [Microbacterium sp. SSM24]MCW3493425.1 Ig-like domain-containing protein [Microbacterium sp. SSM24]
MIPLPRSAARTDRSRGPRRLLASLVGAAFVATALVPVGAAAAVGAAPAAPTTGLLAEYLFDQTAGSSIPNRVSGGAAATVVNGTDSQWTGSSLVFAGGAKTSASANWVRLPDDILAGRTSATVTIETKLDATMKNSWHFLWNIGSDSTTQYYFASVRDNPRTSITATGGGGEVNARSGSALDANRWYSLTSVIDGAAGHITFYVDGVQVARTNTALTPASIGQTLNAIGRAPYPDPMYKGEVSTFRVYDRALTAAEVADVSTADAAIHASSFQQAAQTVADSVAAVTFDEATTTLPTYGGRVSWSSSDPAIEIGADGVTATADQPATGQAPVETTLTATATVRGATATRAVPVTVKPQAGADDAFGYAMVHFIEDSAGYAEKIYLDVSRGDNPEQWDPLNAGKPILASDLGTTGIRDPYLTYNPETGTYYIIATDLRVFGGDRGVSGCTEWCYWSSKGNTTLNVWESKDLVSWSDLRQFDVALSDGAKVGEFGMAWAPEATWVPDYYGAGEGAFVLYWSSNVYANAEHTGSSYSRILWGATPDFTQETYEYGGTFIDAGGNTIDTTIIQNEGTTYRITKDNSAGKGIYLESTTAAQWWKPAATWTQLQTRIGAVWAGGNAGGVEGPAVFQRHGEESWYLYVDVIPSTGYRPMQTNDLDAGFTQLVSSSFFMAPSTKHGGIVGLTKAQYDEIRAADAATAVTADLGSVEVEAAASESAVRAALPAEADVVLAYGRGTASQPVTWDLAGIDTSEPGSYEVTGTVRTIGANLNQWVGAGGSTAWNAPGRQLYSSTAVTVTAEVVVAAPVLPVTVVADTRCVSGKVTLTVRVTNDGAAPVALGISTPYGSKSVAAVAAGKSASAAFTTRQSSITTGSVAVTVTSGGTSAAASGAFTAASCG